jgi:hypothetical protein
MEQSVVGVRRGRSVDASGSSGEDDTRDLEPLQLLQGSVVLEEGRVETEPPDPAAYEVRVLAAKVEYRYASVQELLVQTMCPLSA